MKRYERLRLWWASGGHRWTVVKMAIDRVRWTWLRRALFMLYRYSGMERSRQRTFLENAKRLPEPTRTNLLRHLGFIPPSVVPDGLEMNMVEKDGMMHPVFTLDGNPLRRKTEMKANPQEYSEQLEAFSAASAKLWGALFGAYKGDANHVMVDFANLSMMAFASMTSLNARLDKDTLRMWLRYYGRLATYLGEYYEPGGDIEDAFNKAQERAATETNEEN